MIDAKQAYELRAEICDAAPALVGTEKQIKWANDLRANMILFLCSSIGEVYDYEIGADDNDIPLTITEDLVRKAAAVADAKFWIDTRDLVQNERAFFQSLKLQG